MKKEWGHTSSFRMNTPLRVLMVEDSEDDARLLVRKLKRGGYAVAFERVDTAAAMSVALEREAWDMIIADYAMPGFNGTAALALFRGKGLDLPFIIVSGAIGEDIAVEAMKAGANDYVMKGNLARLVPAVRRELREAEVRREHKRAEEALQEAHDNLERLVRERAAEILMKNRQLMEEIEERKRTEGKLRSSEEKYRHIYENIQDLYYEIGVDGIIQELSPSLERLTKFKRNELIGESIYKLYASPEEREDFLKIMLKTGRVNDYEITMKDKDGEFVTCSLCSRLVFNEKGVPHKIVGSMRDITKRKQAERALWESERRLSDIIDFLPDATFVIDREGKVIAWNRAIEEITGFRAEDMVGKGEYEYALPFYGIRRPILIDLVFEPSEDIEKKYSFVKKRGSVLLAETDVIMKEVACVLWGIAGPLCDSRGNIVGAIESIRDITHRKRAEEKLKSSREQLRALARRVQAGREEERTGIAREIHDQLGQTLTSLKIDLSLLANSLSKIRTRAKRDLLLDRTESMTRLIETTIQTVRRIATELRPGILDDLGLVAALEWQLQDFMNRTGIQCEFITDLKEISLEEERSTAIFRIFQEALTNVARHANATRVTGRVKEESNKLILELEDNGRGITNSEIHDSKSLGLLGMRERALFLGGEFSIVGHPRGGTSVTVKILL